MTAVLKEERNVNNGNGATLTQDPPSRPTHIRMKPRPSNLLWKMLGIAVAVHLVVILCTSKSLFFSDTESAQQIFEKGESAMAAGKYLEAIDYYQKVLDMQPKLPPVFERAAEQHRAADRKAKEQAAKAPATREIKPDSTGTGQAAPASQPLAPVKVIPATKPDFSDIPPELRP